MVEAVDLVDTRMKRVLGKFASKIGEHKDLPALGQTHMQAGEPITLGLRLSVYANDFLMDYEKLQFMKDRIWGKGIKGPVGTMAEVHELLEGTNMDAFEHEQAVMDELGLKAFPVTNQTYPRKLTADVIGVLADIGVSAKKFGMNMRLYQSSLFDELAEPRNPRDIGSSSMPHKRNPRHAENVMALARGIKFKHLEAQEVAEEVPMERGIDDSAGKRSFLPESFLATDEVLRRVENIVDGLVVHENSLYRNLHNFAQFTASAPILTILTKEGADREYIHDKLFGMAGQAFLNLQENGVNNFAELVLQDEELRGYAAYPQIAEILKEPETHVGVAPELCERFLQNHLNPALANSSSSQR
jgi:adenylosuccinate lyase